MQSAHDNDSFLPDDHTVPIMEPERLQEAGSYLTLDEFDKMTRLFAMPAEDFPPATPSQCLSVRFCRDIELKGARLVNLYPCSYYKILLLVDKTLDSCAFFLLVSLLSFFSVIPQLDLCHLIIRRQFIGKPTRSAMGKAYAPHFFL
jgi:hypothetical protein